MHFFLLCSGPIANEKGGLPKAFCVLSVDVILNKEEKCFMKICFLRFSINFEADDNFFVVAVNFKSDLAY